MSQIPAWVPEQYIWHSDEGYITLQIPRNLSPDSISDLEDWLELVMRRMRRHKAQQEHVWPAVELLYPRT